MGAVVTRRRPIVLAAVAVAALALAGPAAARGAAPGAGGAPRLQQLERGVLAALNRVRRDHGLEPFLAQRSLASAALAHARAMARTGRFAHESADGTTFDQRIRRFYKPAGWAYWGVGENLLFSSGRTSPAKAVELWFGSPGHRRNMLDPRWREVGVAAVRVRNAPGTFGGRDVTIVVSDFGYRR
jgi:uncharacterized protein YkwD